MAEHWGRHMSKRSQLRKGPVIALVAASMLAAGVLATPGARMGWAAQMTDTFVWGKSGDADTLSAALALARVTPATLPILVRSARAVISAFCPVSRLEYAELTSSETFPP